MLSYRHAYHAGNHADVLKHCVLVQVLRYLNQKEKPYWFVDTHAGAGRYLLDSEHAQKKAEAADGIGRLWHQEGLPEMVERYVHQVRAMNSDGRLRHYPGSPWLAHEVAGADSKLRLFELHGTDTRLLEKTFARAGTRVVIRQADGFQELKSVLPPPPRRALILIDPSYEDKRDYLRVPASLKEALSRFPTGIYAVWYPQLSRGDARELPGKLRKLASKWLDVRLTVKAPQADGFGMHGSGMFIINPPWPLEDSLGATLPFLVKALAQDESATFSLESSEQGSQPPRAR